GELGLSLKKQLTKWIETLGESWARLGPDIVGDPTAAEVRRWVSTIGRLNTDPFFRIAAARWTVSRTFSPAVVRSLYGRAVRAAFRNPVEIGDLAIDGNDLIAAGIPPGPRLRQILESLLDQVFDDPRRNTREYLLHVLPRPTT